MYSGSITSIATSLVYFKLDPRRQAQYHSLLSHQDLTFLK